MTNRGGIVLLMGGMVAGGLIALVVKSARAEGPVVAPPVGARPVAPAVVAPSPPPPPSLMGNRFQYTCFSGLDYDMSTPAVLKKLNEMGERGWRLLDSRTNAGLAYSDVYCFEKRY